MRKIKGIGTVEERKNKRTDISLIQVRSFSLIQLKAIKTKSRDMAGFRFLPAFF